MRASGVTMMSEEVDGATAHSVSAAGVTLTTVTDMVSAKVHSLFLAIQQEQGCCRSHLHLARAQGAHDLRRDLGDLIFLFRRELSADWSGEQNRFDVRFAAYSQVLCEEISPSELKVTSLVEWLSSGGRV